jgi:hypothetical protein
MKTIALLLALATPLAAQETVTHELVTMTLPAGWTVQPKPVGAEAEYVAALQASNKAVNVIVTAADYGSLKDAAARGAAMIQAALPGAVADTVFYEVQADNGDKVRIQSFTATVQYGGKDVPVAAMLAVTVNSKRGVIAQVYFAPQFAALAGREFGQLVRSFR